MNRSLTATAFLCLALVPVVEGQAPTRSPQAAVADLENGRLDDPDLLSFQGCPQEDAIGRSVFEAVQDIELAGHDAVRMAIALSIGGVYPNCDYPPLNEWMVRTFRRLHAVGESGQATAFARILDPRLQEGLEELIEYQPARNGEAGIHEELQEALLAAAADSSFALEGSRTVMADAAVFNGPRGRQISMAIAAYGRGVPKAWRTRATYRLGRTFGGSFFQALADAAPGLDDRAMHSIASAIRNDILDGRIRPDEPGLNRLREHVRSRASLPPWVHIPPARR